MRSVAMPGYHESSIRRFHASAWGIAIVAFLISPYGPLGWFWRPAVELPINGFMASLAYVLMLIVRVICFGYAVSFLLFKWKKLPALPSLSLAATRLFVAITALLTASWWVTSSISEVMRLSGLGKSIFFDGVFQLLAMGYGLFLVFVIIPKIGSANSDTSA
ncbi:hypothetical protein HGA91_03955 [candidate division WWE3 bacterium]|nr:hypothetical protein [candidate division WWE3 bacterium]